MFPFSFLYFGEFVVVEIVLGVHLDHLSFSGGSHDLNDLDQVINAALADEQRNPVEHFENDTAQRPDVDHGRIVGGSEDEFWCSVAARTDIR